MRLIDADKLIFESTRGNSSPEDIGFWDGVFYASSKMISAPTVDAVEVVRCKDCKHRDGTPGQPNILCYQMHDDDFCSYGEREELTQ